MDTPLLNQNLCKPLQNGAKGPTQPISAVEQQTQQTRAATTRAGADHSKTTTFPSFDHNIERTRSEQVAKLETSIDRRMAFVLLDLSTVSQIRGTTTEMQAADANALRLPVSSNGKGLTEDPCGLLRADYTRAQGIGSENKRIVVKMSLLNQAKAELKHMRFARKGAIDLGTQDGRLEVARFALAHGSRRAAEAFCHDPEDDKSVKHMQRNVQRYMDELKRMGSK